MTLGLILLLICVLPSALSLAILFAVLGWLLRRDIIKDRKNVRV